MDDGEKRKDGRERVCVCVHLHLKAYSILDIFIGLGLKPFFAFLCIHVERY